jgi:Rad3-related DNA helicase
MQANCCVHRQDPPPVCNPCEFNRDRKAYTEANFALTTFDYFLSTHWRGSADRELLIVDESSDLEELLLKHLSIKLDAARGWSNLDDPNVLDKFLLEWYVFSSINRPPDVVFIDYLDVTILWAKSIARGLCSLS